MSPSRLHDCGHPVSRFAATRPGAAEQQVFGLVLRESRSGMMYVREQGCPWEVARWHAHPNTTQR